jgi:primosomal protein N'
MSSLARKKRKLQLKPSPNFPSLAVTYKLSEPVLTQEDLSKRQALLDLLETDSTSATSDTTEQKTPHIGGAIQNLYETLPKEYQEKQETYATYNQIQISTPFRMLIVGASGSGKTNALINLIRDMNAFDMYYLYAKNIQEPLYRYFIDTLR